MSFYSVLKERMISDYRIEKNTRLVDYSNKQGLKISQVAFRKVESCTFQFYFCIHTVEEIIYIFQ